MDLTFGLRLRAHRERQRIELTKIADDTKINIALLEGLERNDVSRWPHGVYRRAYIRAYARAIALEPEPLLKEFLDLYPDPVDEPPTDTAEEASSPGRSTTRIGLALAALANWRPTRPLFVDSTADSAEPEVPLQPQEESSPALPMLAIARHSTHPERPPTPGPSHTPLSAGEVREARRPSRRRAKAVKRDDQSASSTIASIARLSTTLGCARSQTEVSEGLRELSEIVDASGVVLWLWDSMHRTLYPAVVHGYGGEALAKLPRVDPKGDNAIAAAFNAGHTRVVRGAPGLTGAIAAPLLTPTDSAGVLALEFEHGGEQHHDIRAVIEIITAQLSTLICSAPVSRVVNA
jgi:hypothetical protein